MRWWQIRKRDADLARELESDLELEEEEQRDRGLSPEEARYAARRALGNTTLIHEQTRATWSWGWTESLLRDLGYGFRGMRRNAGSTVLAILIVGLGIGGASTVFSVVNALRKWIGSLLFATTSTDPVVFAGVVILLCAVALMAAYGPARRASLIDPVQALRTE